MSQQNPMDFDSTLIEFHFGKLDADAAAAVQARIAADPSLAEQNEALAGVFAALKRLEAPAAPTGLAERVQARLHASPTLRLVGTPQKREMLEREGGRVIRFGNLRDIIAIAAMVVLSIGLGVPSFMQIRERNQRLACSMNLAQIGHAMQSYATTFGESLPFAGWRDGDSWKPGDGVASVMPNRRHVYLLAREREAQPEWFVCPSSGGVPMPRGVATAGADFPEARNLSYAYQNMSGARPTRRDSAELPIMADDNPCFNDGLPLFEMRRRMKLSDPTNSNSNAHQGRGQNLLTGDGRVKWTISPNCGVNGDNIWTLSGVQEYTGHEGASTTSDSHLIK